jgi:DNA polymerase-3 subunit delta'
MSPFAPLIGQPQVVEMLTQAVARERVAPAYLFAGPEGIGRSLAAECFLELLFSVGVAVGKLTTLRQRIRQRNHPDLLWVEPTYLNQGKRLTVAEATATGFKSRTPPLVRLEQVREIARFLSRSPMEASRSVVVLEQAEAMPENSANALLKTLEEPWQATLILIAPGVESLLPTLVSRCQRIPFYRLTAETTAQILQQLGKSDLLTHPDVLQLAQGSPGEAIAHWQKLQTVPTEVLQAATQMPRSSQEALTLARQIDQGVELETQLWLIGYLQHSYWQRLGSVEIHPTLPSLKPLHLLERARHYLLRNVNSRLVWEATLLQML